MNKFVHVGRKVQKSNCIVFFWAFNGLNVLHMVCLLFNIMYSDLESLISEIQKKKKFSGIKLYKKYREKLVADIEWKAVVKKINMDNKCICII